MWLVMRAPFLPIGSLAIWTRISWPSLSRSLIRGTGADSAAAETASASTSAAALAVARATLPVAVLAGTRALRALRITGGCGGSANFHAGIDGAVAARFGVEHGFRFGLGLFEFQFFAVVFAFRRGRLPRDGPRQTSVSDA